MVKRYDPGTCNDVYGDVVSCMDECPDGKYVPASDYDALLAERDLLLAVKDEYSRNMVIAEYDYDAAIDTPILDAHDSAALVCPGCDTGACDEGGWHCKCTGHERWFLKQWTARNRGRWDR